MGLFSCLALLFVFWVGASSADSEASALLDFKKKISLDPRGALGGWSDLEGDFVCEWHGITCEDGRVTRLELPYSSLQGAVSPALAELECLERIDLRGNKLNGPLPRELCTLRRLNFLDVSGNQLTGSIPEELGNLENLQTLNLANNKFVGVLPGDALCKLVKLEILDLSKNALGGIIPGCVLHHPSSKFEQSCLYGNSQNANKSCVKSRRLLQNAPLKNATGVHHNRTRQYPRVHHPPVRHISRDHPSPIKVGFLVAVPVFGVVAVLCTVFFFFYKRRTAAVSPWKAGMSGHLQKVFETDVPSLSWAELQAACEDFSNIIGNSPDCVVFKGTLSDGAEVSVTSIRIPEANWTASSEIFFRRKIEALARMNHTHLVNLLGYCSDDKPFARMLVFEYAPNGTLADHLHNEDAEHLDWDMRMRVVMGAAYGLEYMHHDLVPPAIHSNFDSNAIYLTEDYAAKLADFGITKMALIKSDRRKSFSNNIGYDDFEGSDRHAPDFENNVFSFGLFLLEIVTGRQPYSDKDGPLLDWALDYLMSPETIGFMVDPSLKTFVPEQLLAVCEVVRLCIQPDSNRRPTMKMIAAILSKELNISPAVAQPKVSPLLWAELALLSPSELPQELPSH